MEDWEKLVLGALALWALQRLYSKWLEHRKDVNDVYLQQQSEVEPTRRAHESAIHRSNKLYTGLRGGLEIRYDHYKMRAGNLRDVWQLYISETRKHNRHKQIVINGATISVGALNASSKKLASTLGGSAEITIRAHEVLSSVESLVTLVACFMAQVSIVVVDRGTATFTGGKLEGKAVEIQEEDFEFENVYRKEYDQGTAIKVVSSLGRVVSEACFTQANLTSAVASSLKHLPDSHSLLSRDVVGVCSEGNTDYIVADIIKVLCAFVAFSDLVISSSPRKLLSLSVLSIEEARFLELYRDRAENYTIGLASIRLRRSLQLFSKNIFAPIGRTELRLVYLQHKLGLPITITPAQLNVYRSVLGARVIVEQVSPAVAGPVVLTDIYDYRVMPPKFSGYGCLSQSLEIKLADARKEPTDGLAGEIHVRGYNIASLNKYVLGLPLGERVTSAKEGFMPLGISARWGNDGCLYIMK